MSIEIVSTDQWNWLKPRYHGNKIHLKMHYASASSIYKIIVTTKYKNRRCILVTKFIGAVITICAVRMSGHRHPRTRPAQIRSAHGGSLRMLRWDQRVAESNPMGAKKKSNLESNWIWWWCGWISNVEEVLESDGIGARGDRWTRRFRWWCLQIRSLSRRETRMGSMPPTPTSKPITSMPSVPTCHRRGHLPIAVAGLGKP
jgi:hypothetical protein